jgi:polyhydroxyalkanoate synthase
MIGIEEIRSKFFQGAQNITALQIDVWQTPFDVVHEEEPFRLIHYHTSEKRYKTPILQVYAYINRPYILDLEPDVSVVRRLLEYGFDIYMIDWGYPKKMDRFIDIEDYVDYMYLCVDIVKREAGVDKLTLHGYCLGGTLSAIYAALNPENIRNLVAQATPIDFDNDATMTVWAKSLDVDKIADTLGCAPGDFLNLGFLSVDPIRLIIGKYTNLVEHITEEQFLKNFLRMERWIYDSPAIPGATYKRYIKEWYQENKLIKGEFKIYDEKVDLTKIDMPTLALVANRDHIVPPESATPLLDKISSTDKQLMTVDRGHIGLSVSRIAHKELWPKACEWLGQRS